MIGINIAEARKRDLVGQSGRIRNHLFFGEPMTLSEGPEAFLVEMCDPHSQLPPHFHDVDQFQIVAEGEGRLGRHPLHPMSCHYADGFTPYGPIIADERGLSYFTIRLHAAGGTFRIPQCRSMLPGSPGRSLFNSFDNATPVNAGESRRDVLSAPMQDGLAMIGLCMGAGATAVGEPSDAGGQFMLVCSGSLTHEVAVYERLALIWLEAGELAPVISAGPEGASILIMQFPRPSDRPGADLTRIRQRSKGDFTNTLDIKVSSA
jgi:hypothetical protein